MNKNVSKKTNTKAKLSTLFMILMLMVSAMGLVACTKESNENEDKAKVTSESQNKTDDKGTDTQVENEESDTEDAKENVKKEPGILKSKTEKMSGTSWVYYYEYDKNGFEIKNVTTDMSTGNIITHVEYVFDDNGNCLESHDIVTSNTSLFPHTVYEYDEHGNLTKEFHLLEDGTKGEPYRVYEYVYDNYGSVISKVEKQGKYTNETTFEITYDNDGRKLSSVCRYNGSVRTKEEWSYYADGTVKQHIRKDDSEVTTTDYNENGYEIKIVVNKDYTNELVSHDEYAYDDKGNMISEKSYNITEEYWSETKYSYDEAGNLTKKQWFKDDAVKGTNEYIYNEYGRLDKIIDYVKESSYNYEIVYTYDENDNLLNESWKDDDGVFTSIEYTYYE